MTDLVPKFLHDFSYLKDVKFKVIYFQNLPKKKTNLIFYHIILCYRIIYFDLIVHRKGGNIGWFIKLSVQTFQPLIVIYRRGNISSLGMYINLSSIVLSLKIPELINIQLIITQFHTELYIDLRYQYWMFSAPNDFSMFLTRGKNI